jgi:hypothetical protein
MTPLGLLYASHPPELVGEFWVLSEDFALERLALLAGQPSRAVALRYRSSSARCGKPETSS